MTVFSNLVFYLYDLPSKMGRVAFLSFGGSNEACVKTDNKMYD